MLGDITGLAKTELRLGIVGQAAGPRPSQDGIGQRCDLGDGPTLSEVMEGRLSLLA